MSALVFQRPTMLNGVHTVVTRAGARDESERILPKTHLALYAMYQRRPASTTRNYQVRLRRTLSLRGPLPRFVLWVVDVRLGFSPLEVARPNEGRLPPDRGPTRGRPRPDRLPFCSDRLSSYCEVEQCRLANGFLASVFGGGRLSPQNGLE